MEKIKLSKGQFIAYQRIEGREDAPYILFLHEGLGCTRMWKGFPEALCRHLKWPGLLYDRQGYGHSARLSQKRTIHYLHDYALRELPEVIVQLIPPGKPYIIVGHSDGGSIGLIHASEQPSNLKGMITEAAHVFVEPVTLDGIEEAVRAFERGALDSLGKYHGDKTSETFRAWADTWLSPNFKHWNIDYLLPSVTCPVMALQGKQDQYGTFSQVDRIVNQVSGKAVKCMIDQCGHAPHLQQRKTVLEKISGFLVDAF